ncbi:Nkp1p KNAG_0C04700 [Huiozyma naganishii CBS 8797]|uniref:Uncharacterized protein n=1 Tax=Huiozyma naganishii (strain ATCC MYA-139 / BCRC 22969 / CBS 8797 / KCTC 17520 / NBRC 10181 / NCYC 3082 / Yp74L-3) TaxID=1071383 RepID=J7S672_HUIN7|nr:hypothetical protein KNAG_0C04700 [Kazachstania naganishii CBS 8797]CCK69571.1 hypothetical protein KNAG_0C04700 [Kazachstania naganishii CBS 8797]
MSHLEHIATFLDEEVTRITDPTTAPTGVPPDIVDLVNAEIARRRADKTDTTTRDFVARKVYQLAHRKKLTLFKCIVHDIQTNNALKKTEIGDSIGAISTSNLKTLIENIYKLPSLTDLDTTGTQEIQSLREYLVLRKELMAQCTAIEIGGSKLKELREQNAEVELLRRSILETTGSDDIVQYLKTYHSKLVIELKELTLTLEEKIKSSNQSPAQLETLRTILKELQD